MTQKTPPAPAPDPVRFTIFDTSLGECGIAWGQNGIVATELPGDDDEAPAPTIRTAHPAAKEQPPPAHIVAVIDRIRAIFAGADDDLGDVILDFRDCSDFERRAYAFVRTISPGHTMTYGEVATALGDPGLARAVGRAMGNNPCPIVMPCHRVMGADGSIGGFSAAGGARTKRRMLLAEGVAEHDGPALFSPELLYDSDS